MGNLAMSVGLAALSNLQQITSKSTDLKPTTWRTIHGSLLTPKAGHATSRRTIRFGCAAPPNDFSCVQEFKTRPQEQVASHRKNTRRRNNPTSGPTLAADLRLPVTAPAARSQSPRLHRGFSSSESHCS